MAREEASTTTPWAPPPDNLLPTSGAIRIIDFKINTTRQQ
jgi:hypothetical protein